MPMLDPLDPKTLKGAREKANMTRADLALAAGISETTVLRIESGRVDPRLDSTWAPIVRALAPKRRTRATNEVAL